MAFDADKAWVIWPEYFDVIRSRAAGRRVKKGLAVQEPTMDMIVKAVQKLGLEYKLEEGKSYPGQWWNKQGMLLVENSMSKSALLAKIGEQLQRIHRS